ncbi:hypothetical protein [Kiloniella antarctica]|uniref:Uncharacterized protein n=1 Tax=Kiloniella antarctica TaxID=1550907 RepID=A0ABW5BFY8_9PROT
MKAIKIAVIAMSVLLVVGFGVVIYTISTRVSDGTLSKSSVKTPVEAVSAETSKPDLYSVFGKSSIKISPGCRLVDAELQSGNVLMRFDGAVERGCQKVMLFSSKTGALLGEWFVANSASNP